MLQRKEHSNDLEVAVVVVVKFTVANRLDKLLDGDRQTKVESRFKQRQNTKGEEWTVWRISRSGGRSVVKHCRAAP